MFLIRTRCEGQEIVQIKMEEEKKSGLTKKLKLQDLNDTATSLL